MDTRPINAGMFTNAAKQRIVNDARGRRSRSPHRANVLTPEQFEQLLDCVQRSERRVRDSALVLVLFGCGLRIGEVAGLQWERNVLDASGKVSGILRVTKDIAKRSVERRIPIPKRVRAALTRLRQERPHDRYVIYPLYRTHLSVFGSDTRPPRKCDPNTLAQYLRRLYRESGLVGCTSHSGRRTFITELARKCNNVGASVRDVQRLAGHRSLATTQDYIECTDRDFDLVELAVA